MATTGSSRRESRALTRGEIQRIVNRYIGVEGGYLDDFSYASHAAFYPEYCDLDIDPYEYEGTTRRALHRHPVVAACAEPGSDHPGPPRSLPRGRGP